MAGKTNRELIDEGGHVSEMMQRYGGGFMEHIGRALRYADAKNIRKIYETWQDDWERYAGFPKQ